MLSRIGWVLLAAPLLLASTAWAQASAAPAGGDGPVASAGDRAFDAQLAAYLDRPPIEIPRQAGQAAVAPLEGAHDRAVHGEAGFGIGSNGYREAYAAMIAPIGKSGTAAVAVSDVRFNGRRGPRSEQSLSVAVALGEAGGGPALARDCLGPHGGATLEPLWEMRLRATHPGAGLACPHGAMSR